MRKEKGARAREEPAAVYVSYMELRTRQHALGYRQELGHLPFALLSLKKKLASRGEKRAQKTPNTINPGEQNKRIPNSPSKKRVV